MTQQQAGCIGRKTGHRFEENVASGINSLSFPIEPSDNNVTTCIRQGDPSHELLKYVADFYQQPILSASAVCTGTLATSENKVAPVQFSRLSITRSKSDVVIDMKLPSGPLMLGVSTKQCNNIRPTNAQIYFSTARGFVSLLRRNKVEVSEEAESGLRRFCGDEGFRPLDLMVDNRKTDPRRFFWEELSSSCKDEWARLFTTHGATVTKLLLGCAYSDDPCPPQFLLHKTRRSVGGQTEVAVFNIDHFSALSASTGFATKSYSVRKGQFKDPKGITHEAPRFGYVQMQRGGQKQHPTQLQFNLQAGYFYKIP